MPNLNGTLTFVQRHRAIPDHGVPAPHYTNTSASTATQKPTADIDQLVGLNVRASSPTESARRPSGHFPAVICHSNQTTRTSTIKSCVFSSRKTRPHSSIEIFAVQEKSKITPTCNSTSADGTDTSPENVRRM